MDGLQIQRTRSESVTFLLFLEIERYCKMMKVNGHRCMRLACVYREGKYRKIIFIVDKSSSSKKNSLGSCDEYYFP